jgi:hypothetical protein
LLSLLAMAHLETIRRRAPLVAKSRAGTTVVLAMILLLMVSALAALSEVVAARAVRLTTTSRTSTWQPLLQIADEARARGDVLAARRAYLTALFRARGERSLPGVLGAAEGFNRLGDRDVVEQALRIAGALGPVDGEADADASRRLQALNEQLHAADALPSAAQTLR